MKKIFTLVAAMLMAFGVNAQTEVDIPLDGWGWGWGSTTSYENGILTGEITGGYGAISTGWDTPQDWSAYNKLTVVLESYNNDWGKVFFQDEKGQAIAEQSFTNTTTTTKVEVDFDPTLESVKSVKQLAVQGKAAGDVVKVSRVYLTEAVETVDGTPIVLWEGENDLGTQWAWNQTLLLSAMKFAKAKEDKSPKLDFYFTEDVANAEYWQLKTVIEGDQTALTSNATEINDYDCVELQAEATTYSITLNAEDLAKLKAKGLRVQGYGVILNKVTLTNQSSDPDAINTIETSNKPLNNGAMYNLAGQMVDKSYKGIVIQNGNKFFNK